MHKLHPVAVNKKSKLNLKPTVNEIGLDIYRDDTNNEPPSRGSSPNNLDFKPINRSYSKMTAMKSKISSTKQKSHEQDTINGGGPSEEFKTFSSGSDCSNSNADHHASDECPDDEASH